MSASWGETDTGRRARFYRLTDEGRQHLDDEAPRLAEHSKAVLALLERAPG